MDDRHQEVWYENDQGVTQRVKVCPGTDWPFLLKSVPGARVMDMERKADGLHATPYETPKFWAWAGWSFETPPLASEKKDRGRIVRFTPIDKLPDPTPAWEAPKCEMCETQAWIFTTHPLNKKNVCLECAKKGTPGWVPCPATHGKGSCPLCRNTPGFIEEV